MLQAYSNVNLTLFIDFSLHVSRSSKYINIFYVESQ